MPFTTSKHQPSVKRTTHTQSPPTIYFEGYLNKQKHGRCKAFIKRYFVLYGEELRYYKSKSDQRTVLAVISLDHYSLVPLTTVNTHTFCLVSDDETKYDWPDYYLQASSDLERREWVHLLERFVSQSTSVLEKWLHRVDLTDSITTAPNLQPSTSCSSLPHTTKSFESLPPHITKKTIKRRPSDYLLSTTRHLMSPSSSSSSSSIHLKESNSSKISKLFLFKTKSTCSSMTSSTIDLHEEDNDDTPPTVAPEKPIINPKDFDNSFTQFYYYSK